MEKNEVLFILIPL